MRWHNTLARIWRYASPEWNSEPIYSRGAIMALRDLDDSSVVNMVAMVPESGATLSGVAILTDQVCGRGSFAQGAMDFPCLCQEPGLTPLSYRSFWNSVNLILPHRITRPANYLPDTGIDANAANFFALTDESLPALVPPLSGAHPEARWRVVRPQVTYSIAPA